MQVFYADDSEQCRCEFRLYSLAEYETDGGVYSDAGNGGEDMRDAREQFIAAMAVIEDHGDSDAAFNVAGLDRGAAWYDSATGYYLIRDWPAEAPLAARMVNTR